MSDARGDETEKLPNQPCGCCFTHGTAHQRGEEGGDPPLPSMGGTCQHVLAPRSLRSSCPSDGPVFTVIRTLYVLPLGAVGWSRAQWEYSPPGPGCTRYRRLGLSHRSDADAVGTSVPYVEGCRA